MTPVCLPTDISSSLRRIPFRWPACRALILLQVSPLANSFPSTQNILFWPATITVCRGLMLPLRPDPATLPVPCSRLTPTLARTYFGHDNLAYYYSRQSQSGVSLWILWIIRHRNSFRLASRRRFFRRPGPPCVSEPYHLSRLWRSAFSR
jgi:hypothetical protein